MAELLHEGGEEAEVYCVVVDEEEVLLVLPCCVGFLGGILVLRCEFGNFCGSWAIWLVRVRFLAMVCWR